MWSIKWFQLTEGSMGYFRRCAFFHRATWCKRREIADWHVVLWANLARAFCFLSAKIQSRFYNRLICVSRRFLSEIDACRFPQKEKKKKKKKKRGVSCLLKRGSFFLFFFLFLRVMTVIRQKKKKSARHSSVFLWHGFSLQIRVINFSGHLMRGEMERCSQIASLWCPKKRNSIAAIRYLRVPFNSSGTLIYRKMKPTLTRLFIMVRQSLHILQQGCFHSPHTLLTSLSLSHTLFFLLLLLFPPLSG